MNDRQRIAFQCPCVHGRQTMHDRYFRLARVNGRLLSTILTVDTFTPRPMWHASVGVLHMRKLSASTKRILITVATELLAGVGQDDSRFDETHAAMHHQRSLTDEEIAALRAR
jgi:hypothetical protein